MSYKGYVMEGKDPLFPIYFLRMTASSLLGVMIGVWCEASGQKINLRKSSVFFGNKCQDNVKQGVKRNLLEVDNEILHDSYLGMPTEIARAISSSFKFLSDRVWRSVSTLNDKPMSRAGKEAMLKSVTQAIPNYVMSCFQVPVGIFNKMKSNVANHWWGFEDGRKKMHWRSWD